MKVWDRPVRVLHWSLAASLAVSAAGLADWGLQAAHQPAGYFAVAIVLLRVVWGFVAASATARFSMFSGFVRGPRATLAYARDVLRAREPRHVGHNPLGAWMIVALLLCVAALAVSGWLYTSDWLWGDATVEAVHVALAWTLLALVLLHLAGVGYTSWRQRENLVAAMVTGDKRGDGA